MQEVVLKEVLQLHGFTPGLAKTFADVIIKIARRMVERERQVTDAMRCEDHFTHVYIELGYFDPFTMVCYPKDKYGNWKPNMEVWEIDDTFVLFSQLMEELKNRR